MNIKEETIDITFTDFTRKSYLFELKVGGLVVMTEEGHQARAIGRIPEDGEPWETDFHEWCASYAHTQLDNVLITQTRV